MEQLNASRKDKDPGAFYEAHNAYYYDNNV